MKKSQSSGKLSRSKICGTKDIIEPNVINYYIFSHVILHSGETMLHSGDAHAFLSETAMAQ